MFADDLTLHDLKLFPHISAGRSLFDVLCCTKTIEGKEQLLKYLRRPLSTEEEVYNFQNLIQSILNEYEIWEKFHTLLSSEIFIEVKQQQDNQLLYSASLFKYRIKAPRKESSVHEFIKNLFSICRNITEHSSTGENSIIHKMQITLSSFKKVAEGKFSRNYERWYCYNRNGKLFKTLLDDLYKIDALVSIASVHKKFNFTFPKFSSNKNMHIENLRNILITSSKPNSLRIPSDAETIFLTGANMSGKTTLLISIGQAVYLGRCGFGIPATNAELPWFESIFCAFESNTILEEGLSYFASEVKRSVEAVKLSGQEGTVLILADELFKGTNVKDSIDCLSYFTEKIKKKNVISIISTHLTEFVVEYKEEGTQFWCFEASMEYDKPVFDYTLKRGVSTQRMGFKILENALREQREKDQ